VCGACETFEIELLSEVFRIPEEQQKVTTFLDNSFTTRFVRYGHVSDKTRDGVDSRFYTFANWAGRTTTDKRPHSIAQVPQNSSGIECIP
jgi:hypothetical protein